ncbi:hypothetical protein [Ectobacillus ponti]|uniref:Uncharacterized protein n=1 Tax=Ectobacillus ponti TaxID=2961894 RepID=A0AA41XCU7_9BACI|nr:hypothetical protein [Ectobacillus ponti]MCP8970999.1 hypothetical protein [Ectobacillus ponti]
MKEGETELQTIFLTKTGKSRRTTLSAKLFGTGEKTEILVVARFAADEVADNQVN